MRNKNQPPGTRIIEKKKINVSDTFFAGKKKASFARDPRRFSAASKFFSGALDKAASSRHSPTQAALSIYEQRLRQLITPPVG